MAKKVIFVVQGYDEKLENGTVRNVVYYEVWATSEKEAIDKAKKYLVKNHYRVERIIER